MTAADPDGPWPAAPSGAQLARGSLSRLSTKCSRSPGGAGRWSRCGRLGVFGLVKCVSAEYRPTMDRILAHTRSNRISWNAIAPARPSQPPEFFLQGGTALEDFEPGLLPDVAGKRMLHLACANGNASIS